MKYKNKIFINKAGPSFGPKLDLNKIKQKNINVRSLDNKKSQMSLNKPTGKI